VRRGVRLAWLLALAVWTAPVGATELGRTGLADVAVAGVHAYAVTAPRRGAATLLVLDLTTPEAPVVVGTLDVGGAAGRVAVREEASRTTVYVAASRRRGIVVVDASDPAAPAIVGTTRLGRRPTAVAVAGARLYAGTSRDVHAFDLADPSHPEPRGTLAVGARVHDVAADATALAIATADTRRELIVAGAELAAAETAIVNLPGDTPARSVALGTHTLAVTTGGRRRAALHVFDRTLDVRDGPRASVALDGPGEQVVLRGPWAWVLRSGARGGIDVIDLSRPHAPVRNDGWSLGAAVRRVASAGPYAYVASARRVEPLRVVHGGFPLRAELRDGNGDGAVTISCLGDSNTDAGWWAGPTWVAVLERLLARPDVVLVNAGLGGATAVDVPSWPYDGYGQLASTLAADRPDAVVLSFGTNDLQLGYAEDDVVAAYRALAIDAEAAGAVALVATVPHVGAAFPNALVLNPRYDVVNAALAAAFPADRVIDFATTTERDYMPDALHIDRPGQTRRALAAYERLVF